MAGLSAAAWSVRQGQSVVLVEKGALGGTAIHAGFIWTAPSFEALREAVPEGDPALAQQLIDGFDPAIEWVRSLDVECLPAVTVLRFGRGHQTDMTNYLRLCEQIVRDDPRSTILAPGHDRVAARRGRRRRRAPLVRDADGRRARDPRRSDAPRHGRLPGRSRAARLGDPPERPRTSRSARTTTARATACASRRASGPAS